MKPNFSLANGSYTIHKFHSGELQVTTDADNFASNIITGSVLSSDHIIELLQLVEALRYHGTAVLDLIMPYCAFSRQDRRCNPGEAFSLKVFTDIINSCGFNRITTYDNHSDVATALIDNCSNKSVFDIMYNTFNEVGCYHYLVSPDAGSNKKVQHLATNNHIPMIRADKIRDTLSGEITHTEVFATAEQLNGTTVLIVDDICAGGRTFIELAKALKAIQPNCTIHLFVTHGFFQFGFEDLIQAGISKFITTDSVIDPAYTTNNFSHVTIL